MPNKKQKKKKQRGPKGKVQKREQKTTPSLSKIYDEGYYSPCLVDEGYEEAAIQGFKCPHILAQQIY